MPRRMCGGRAQLEGYVLNGFAHVFQLLQVADGGEDMD
jgi:hypothetical protein